MTRKKTIDAKNRTPLQKKYDRLVKMGMPPAQQKRVEIVYRTLEDKPIQTAVSYGAADYLTV